MFKAMMISAALIAAAAPTAAAVVLDQSFLVQPTGPANVVQRVGRVSPPNQPETYLGGVQTFTAGTAGRLARIEFQAFNMSPQLGALKLSLIDGDYAAGARSVLAVQYTPFPALPSSPAARAGTTVSFDTLDAGFVVAAGTRYSVLFEAEVAPGLNFAGIVVGTATAPVPGQQPTFYSTDYAGGQLFGFTNGVFNTTPSRFDAGFQSFVDTSVPEPASWALMILGFSGTGAALRRRKRVAFA
ncbi:PEPxxWA-CTERM sorting domain-containing protein [Sphingomonas sp.]|jgi:hypothetical protein|uniref:PEPxxWA-CTERM sorting domain-containing protein n=1 Tax=Sphingomonas sp. TaxID=28214 RepID=UPI002DEFB88B|nr:PEPxxWA-CTERM sorting domain-containing protein [Sphingomonas sp.]